MSRTTRRGALLHVTSGLLAASTSAHQTKALAQLVAKPTFTIGQSVSLTGPLAPVGSAFAAAARQFVAAFNTRVDAKVRVVLRQIDDASDQERSSVNGTLLMQEGASMLFGPVGPSACNRLAAIAERSNTILFAPCGASDSLLVRRPRIYSMRAGFTDEAQAILQHCSSAGWTKISAIGDSEFGGEVVQRMTREAALRGLPPVPTVILPLQPAPAASTLRAVVESNPQVLVLAASTSTTATIVSTVRHLGFHGAIISFSCAGVESLSTALGDDSQGVMVVRVVPSPRNEALAVAREFRRVAADMPSHSGLEGFMAAKSLCEAIQRVQGQLTIPSLQKSIDGLQGWDIGGIRIELQSMPGRATQRPELVGLGGTGRILQ